MLFKSRLSFKAAQLSTCALALMLCACGQSQQAENVHSEAITESEALTTHSSQNAVLGSFGIALENINDGVKPGDNFFKYVNGHWLERTDIPADKSNYGSFTILADQAEQRVRAIIEQASQTDNLQGGAAQRIGELYASFMDSAAIEKAGLSPLENDLAGIYALKTHSDIAAAAGDPARMLTLPFGYYVYIDYKQPDTYITQITQTGLGLPDRDYYLREDDNDVELRAKYLNYLSFIMARIGADDPSRSAARIMEFETKIATAQWDQVKRRDRNASYNKMSFAAFKDYASGVDWDAMLGASGLGNIDAIILRQDDSQQKAAAIFAETPIDVLQDYMAFHFINNLAEYLPADIYDAKFDVFSRALRGTQEQRARWKRGVSTASKYLGEDIGQIYVEKHFPADSKLQMQDLVENLRATFKNGIDNLGWMDASTKAEAQDKLAKFNPKIGYPDLWEDYSDLMINRGDLIGNIRRGEVWKFQDNMSKLGQPIDREEWGMTPQTVNAYYNSALNEIVFPAAILDAPFFDPNADLAVNYGGIGAVIGHEMGHGFDDQGRKTDGDGRLREWWSEEDAARFKSRTDRLVTQYNDFEALPGLNLNGELTLGENIGDLTGITMAYYAYKRALGGTPAPIIDGLTGDQRFFLSYAQIWQRKFRDEALRTRVKTDVHSPGEFRANGIVRNFGPWYDAFDIQPSDALYLPPEKRVKIW